MNILLVMITIKGNNDDSCNIHGNNDHNTINATKHHHHTTTTTTTNDHNTNNNNTDNTNTNTNTHVNDNHLTTKTNQ